MEVVFLIGSLQSIFFSLLLFSKKANSINKKTLSIWLFLIGIHLLLLFFLYQGWIKGYPLLTIIHITFPLIHYPLFYLYVNGLINNILKFKFQYLWLFSLYPIMFLLHLFFTEHLALYNYWYIASSDYPNGLIHFNLIINLISGFCYLSLCLYQLKRFNERIKNLYSNIDRINFKWLAHLIIGFLIVLLIGIVYLLLTKVFHIIIRYSINFYIYGSITIFIYFIGYYSLKRKGMFFNIDEDILLETTEHETGEIIVAKNKYNIYGLKKTDAAQLKEKLLNYMVEKKPYLDSNLSLSELASQLGIYSHYLTQVLNDELNQNFYDFVNSYRIDEVKRLLFETKYINYTLFAIALEAGFNSKSTFNRIFKKITGISPSNFKNAIKKR